MTPAEAMTRLRAALAAYEVEVGAEARMQARHLRETAAQSLATNRRMVTLKDAFADVFTALGFGKETQ